jgi:hypothetical protein
LLVTGTSLKERRDRTGTGFVRFTSADVKGGTSGPADDPVKTGETAWVTIGLENRCGRNLRKVRVNIGIDDFTGHRIALLSTDLMAATSLEFDTGESRLDVRIERLPLVPGKYWFTLYCAIDGETADWVQTAGFFEVTPGSDQGRGALAYAYQGHVVIDHHFLLRSSLVDALGI